MAGLAKVVTLFGQGTAGTTAKRTTWVPVVLPEVPQVPAALLKASPVTLPKPAAVT